MSIVSYELNGDIGIVRINNPPVNALSHQVRKGITEAIEAAGTDTSRAIVLACEGRTFIAGADITEFGKPPQSSSLPDMLLAIEASAKPVIAALHGTALGGGFETALACHYRCAMATARVGLPEVKLGLLPGAGGTQRVPRLAGVEAALDLITGGNPLPADTATRLGLVDRVFADGDLLAQAIDYARELVAEDAPLKRVRDINIDPQTAPAELFEGYRKKLAKRARGQLAPQHIVSCIEAAVTQPMDAGLQTERQLFIECMQSPQSAAMRHLFFAEREAAKVRGLDRDTPVRGIRTVGIIGGGTMGGGIAMNFANAGIPVTLLELDDDALQRGLGIIAKNYATTVKKGKLTEAESGRRQSLIGGSTDYRDLAEVDLVIEAVFENLDIKKQVFTKLDTVCKPGAILATNTSYQNVDAIAAATARPQDVIGLHFFSPANIMKLLEVVRAEKTAATVIATAMKLAKTIGKIPVLSGVCYGFIGNRMLRYYGREAQLCLLEGCTPEQIDTAMQNWGMAMGPLAVGDLAGLDIGYKARQGLSEAEKGDPKTYAVADMLVEMGRLGQKSGAGYYQYDPETRARTPDPAVLEVVEQQAAKHGVKRRLFEDEEIVNRLIFALVNEGAKILEEGIAQRAGDIDVVYVYGYGFPAARGGPMHYADSLGLKQVYETVCKFRDQYGAENWEPAPLLERLAGEGGTFAAWQK
ncbi:3-hydroxyacyl-CoA dehydrogenase [Exilibacterium tricleocarpae]|uniref:3-hydroxyacyl-CoA dehydrogenase n=1 Tax=Exilibacterium tricleocarpae TaxID=2591008 RepID=A0A545U3D4_9GAMM|nr:3-hydroxyacyl-CoA dehydrogenase NAD-binding domain-containing protein [Exilibacterium tricleocarpae]TQV83997.1 3-hydroxyacyl-CoA dehydrogenase [Exilibacterium tricleocarpae]